MYKWDEMSWRKKNALVAEKVMGEYERFVYSGPSFIYYGVGVRGSYRIEDNFRFNNLQWNVPTDELELGAYVGPNFTSDISAAWEVVEQMKRTRTWAHVDSLKSGKWSAHFGQFDFSFAEADTAPEAICIAALRAVGVEIE